MGFPIAPNTQTYQEGNGGLSVNQFPSDDDERKTRGGAA